MRCECENGFALPALKEGVKTYLIAPMSPPTSPNFFSVYTCVVYGIHVNNHRANTLFSRISAEYRCHGSWEDAGVRFVIVSPLHAEDTFYCVASQLLATPTATPVTTNTRATARYSSPTSGRAARPPLFWPRRRLSSPRPGGARPSGRRVSSLTEEARFTSLTTWSLSTSL